jgi:hypothetical protein
VRFSKGSLTTAAVTSLMCGLLTASTAGVDNPAPQFYLFGNFITGNILGTINVKTQTFSPVMTIERGVTVASIDFASDGLPHDPSRIVGHCRRLALRASVARQLVREPVSAANRDREQSPEERGT